VAEGGSLPQLQEAGQDLQAEQKGVTDELDAEGAANRSMTEKLRQTSVELSCLEMEGEDARGSQSEG
jgi:hypothetical protein